jgi:adenylate kinase family enzyme
MFCPAYATSAGAGAGTAEPARPRLQREAGKARQQTEHVAERGDADCPDEERKRPPAHGRIVPHFGETLLSVPASFEPVTRRFSVMGIPGSGKTTMSRAIATRLGLTHVELDALYHGPNWSEPPREEFERRVAAALEGLEGWVVDGNYRSAVGGLVLESADTIVWLNLPLFVCQRRILRRTWRRILTREELWESKNRETIRNTFLSRDSLFVWAIKAHFRHRRDMPEWIDRHPHLRVVRLRSRREAERWLSTL